MHWVRDLLTSARHSHWLCREAVVIGCAEAAVICSSLGMRCVESVESHARIIRETMKGLVTAAGLAAK